MFRHMLIPTDGSSASVRAIEAGVNLARALDARITFLAVLNPWKVFSLDPLVASSTIEKRYLEESARIGRMRVNVGQELAKSKVCRQPVCSCMRRIPGKQHAAIPLLVMR